MKDKKEEEWKRWGKAKKEGEYDRCETLTRPSLPNSRL